MSPFRALVLVTLLPLLGCPSDGEETGMVGGECTYTGTHGTCTFLEATGGAEVTFAFVSDDGATTDESALAVGDGGAPPTQACLDELGLAEGVEAGCTRQVMEDGACTPIVFEFDDFETNECLD